MLPPLLLLVIRVEPYQTWLYFFDLWQATKDLKFGPLEGPQAVRGGFWKKASNGFVSTVEENTGKVFLAIYEISFELLVEP